MLHLAESQLDSALDARRVTDPAERAAWKRYMRKLERIANAENGRTFEQAVRLAVDYRQHGAHVIYLDTFGFGATPLAWFEDGIPEDYLGMLERVPLDQLAHLDGAAWDAAIRELLRRWGRGDA